MWWGYLINSAHISVLCLAGAKPTVVARTYRHLLGSGNVFWRSEIVLDSAPIAEQSAVQGTVDTAPISLP